MWTFSHYSKIAKISALTLIVTAINACTGGGGGDSAGTTGLPAVADASLERLYPEAPRNCSLPEMRQWVQANMLDYYLFYDQVPPVNLADFEEVEDLIGELRVSPFDRFSYISDAAASDALFEEGKILGYGWKLLRTSESDVRLGFVYPQSPLAEFDVKRGDFLLAINGVHPLSMTEQQWNDFLGTGEEIKSPVMTLLDSEGNQRDLTVTRAEFTIDTVLDARVIESGESRIAYMAFTKFLETSNAEIENAFSLFKQENANELILDLRYNTGGRISVANNLASKIAGNNYAGQIFAEISFNSKYSEQDLPYALGTSTNGLGLDRVIVLSSASTCSASEMIINGLKPFVDVVQLGSTSCGKPYGSAPNEACGKQMNALQFRFVNASGVGDYYDGIPADCSATDTPEFALGDTREGMLKAGLDYLSIGTCDVAASASAAGLANAAGNVTRGDALATSRKVAYQDPLRAEQNIDLPAGSVLR